MSLRTLIINDGRVVLENREGKGSRIVADDIDLVQSIDIGRDLALTSSGEAHISDISLGPLSEGEKALGGFRADFENEVSGDIGAGNIRVERGTLTVNGVPVDVNAEITGWTKTAWSVKTGALDVEETLKAMPPDLVPEQDKLSAEGTFSLDASGTVDSEPDEPVIAYSGSLDLDIAPLAFEGLPKQVDAINGHIAFTEKVITIDNTRVSIGESNALIAGTVENYTEKPVVAIDAKGDMNLDDLAGAVPLPEGTDMSGMVDFDMTMNGSPDDPSSFRADGGMNLRAVEITMPETLNHPAKIDGSLTLKPEHVSLDRIRLVSGESDMTLQGNLTNYMTLAGLGEEKAAFRGTVSSQNLDLNDMLVEKKEAAKTAPVKPWDFEETLTTLPVPANLSSALSLNLGTVKFGMFETDAVKGRISLDEGVMKLSDLNVAAYAGVLTGGTTMNFSDVDNVTYGGDFKLDALDAARFVAALLGKGDIFTGNLSSSLSFNGAGLDSTSMLNNLKMSGDMLMNNGSISNFGFTKKLGEHLKFLDFGSVAFDTIKNSFRVEDRKFITPDMAVMTGFGDIRVNGFVGFDTAVDYDIVLDLDRETSKKALGTISGFSKYLEIVPERLELNVDAGGTLASPSFSLDTSAAEEVLKKNLEQRLADEADKLLDSKDAGELKEKGKKLLNNLFR